MISKTHRFRGRNGINYVYRKGRTVRAPFCSLRVAESRKNTGYHLAIVVSKKVDKRAVVRNRIRRRLYEEFRRQLKNKESLHMDMVVSVFAPQIATISAQEVQNIVASLLKQIEPTS